MEEEGTVTVTSDSEIHPTGMIYSNQDGDY